MRINVIVIIIYVFVLAVVAGCSNDKDYPPRDRWAFGGRLGTGDNLTDEERQNMFEEMQQKAAEACKDKAEGDSCIIEGPIGETESTCKLRDTALVCMPERMPRGDRGMAGNSSLPPAQQGSQ